MQNQACLVSYFCTAVWSGRFWVCQVMQTYMRFCCDWLRCCFAKARSVGWHVMFGESINRNQRTVTVWCMASFAMRYCPPVFIFIELYLPEKGTPENFSRHPSWSQLLPPTCANSAEYWWFLLDLATTSVDSCLVSWDYRTRLLVSWQIGVTPRNYFQTAPRPLVLSTIISPLPLEGGLKGGSKDYRTFIKSGFF